MNALKVNLYSKEFNVKNNYSLIHRFLRSIIITILFLVIILLDIPGFNSYPTFASFLFICFAIFISDKYVRQLYPDWPKKKKFIGQLTISPNELKIRTNDEISIL